MQQKTSRKKQERNISRKIISMVDYVNSVSLTGNETIDDAVKISHRLLRWLQNLNRSVYLEPPVAQAVLQATAIFLYFAKTFENLEQELVRQCSSIDIHLKAFYAHLFEQNGGPMRYIAKLVLGSLNGSRHFVIAMKYLDGFIEGGCSSIAHMEDAIAEANAMNTCYEEVHQLLDVIFQLKNDDILIAINRIIDFQYACNLTFEHVATIICETTGLKYRKKSLIFTNELIRRLEACAIHPRFMESIYELPNKKTIFRVLRVGVFGRAFITFLVDCMTEFQFDDAANSYMPSKKLRGMNFKHFAYVVGLILSAKNSTVRTILCREILGQPSIDPVLIEHLNDQKFIRKS